MQSGSERRYVGDADPLPVEGRDEDETLRWRLDLDMTNCAYLGVSHQCAEDIFASTVIEAVVAEPDDLTDGMDTVNRATLR